MATNAWDPDFDRNRPQFWPIRAAVAPFRSHPDWPSLDDWNAAMPAARSSAGAPIRFVPQPPRSRGGPRDVRSLYDERIYSEGAVASRVRTWHDFFNMLVWATFPRAKSVINDRQRRALREWIDPSKSHLPSARTEEQDVLAMIDEGGIVVATTRAHLDPDPDVVSSAIAAGEARALIFGHALYEHLVLRPEQDVRGFAWPVTVPSMRALPIAELDVALAASLASATFRRHESPALSLKVV